MNTVWRKYGWYPIACLVILLTIGVTGFYLGSHLGSSTNGTISASTSSSSQTLSDIKSMQFVSLGNISILIKTTDVLNPKFDIYDEYEPSLPETIEILKTKNFDFHGQQIDLLQGGGCGRIIPIVGDDITPLILSINRHGCASEDRGKTTYYAFSRDGIPQMKITNEGAEIVTVQSPINSASEKVAWSHGARLSAIYVPSCGKLPLGQDEKPVGKVQLVGLHADFGNNNIRDIKLEQPVMIDCPVPFQGWVDQPIETSVESGKVVVAMYSGHRFYIDPTDTDLLNVKIVGP